MNATDKFGYNNAVKQIAWIRSEFKIGSGMGGISRRQLLASWCQRAREWKYGFSHPRTLARR